MIRNIIGIDVALSDLPRTVGLGLGLRTCKISKEAAHRQPGADGEMMGGGPAACYLARLL